MQKDMTPVQVRVSTKSNVVLVDTSYYVFYRYYATLKCYKYKLERENTTFVKSDDENDDNDENDKNDATHDGREKKEKEKEVAVDYATLYNNPEFVEMFKRHIVNDIASWRKKWSVADNNLIFCKDCSRDAIWRNDFHDNYKGTRVLASTFCGNIFSVFYEFLQELPNTMQLCSHRLEGDDIVYLTTQCISAPDTSFSKTIVILTNDNDYLQLRKEGVSIYNLQGKGTDLATRSKGTPELDLLIKILMGDVSDNISPVWPKVGPKTALKVASMSLQDREQWLRSKGQACVDQFVVNERLVSFACIPEELTVDFFNKYTFVFENE
jgi:5'-3' exonuclease